MTLNDLDERVSSDAPSTMTQGPADATYGGQSDGAMRRLGRTAGTWVLLPVLLGAAGLVAGAVAGAGAHPNAEALVRVQTSDTDAVSADLATKSAVVELQTQQVLGAAARGADQADLRSRTTVQQVSGTQVISITVTAATQELAVQQANAIAESGVSIGQARTQAELDTLTDDTRELIESQVLTDKAAEQARLAQLGGSLGSNQSGLVASSRQLSLLQDAQVGRSLPSVKALAALGLAAGVLLGLALSMLLSKRPRAVSTAAELQALSPRSVVVDQDQLARVFELDAGSVSAVFLSSLTPSPDQPEVLATPISQSIEGAGRTARPGRGIPAPDSLGSDVVPLVHVVPASSVLARVAALDGSVVVIAVELGRTSRSRIEAAVGGLNERTYLVLTSPTHQWD